MEAAVVFWMKPIIPLFAVMLAALVSTQSLSAVPALNVYAESPDHPGTWVVGADNVHQVLRWDAARKMLWADVKYSTLLYADDAHPTKVADYSLSFPSVKLDAETSTFKSHGVVIGTLQHGPLGSNIVLDEGVELDIHRHYGRIYGKLMASEKY